MFDAREWPELKDGADGDTGLEQVDLETFACGVVLIAPQDGLLLASLSQVFPLLRWRREASCGRAAHAQRVKKPVHSLSRVGMKSTCRDIKAIEG